MKHFIYICLLLILAACTKEKSVSSEVEASLEQKVIADPETKTESKEESLTRLNKEIIATVKAGDMEKFASYIHPAKGITLTMYGFVDPTTAKHFSRAEFIQYAGTPVKFTWGNLDGTGESYVRSIGDYLKEWAFAKDFSKTKTYLNTFRGSGNSINNLKKIYPDADFTENYFEGTEQYSKMDWQALRLVFEQHDGKYYLIAVVNDRWTI